MRVNIFSGARRLALVLAAFATLVTLGFAAFHDPYVSLKYNVAAPNARFVHTQDNCPENGSTRYIDASAPGGRIVLVTLCFLPSKFGPEGAELIPYRIDDEGMMWGAAKYSSEVFAYEKEVEQRFRFSPTDIEIIRSEKSRKYWQNWRNTLLYLAIALVIFWVLISAMGWIVRGFAGISGGKDSRAIEDSRVKP